MQGTNEGQGKMNGWRLFWVLSFYGVGAFCLLHFLLVWHNGQNGKIQWWFFVEISARHICDDAFSLSDTQTETDANTFKMGVEVNRNLCLRGVLTPRNSVQAAFIDLSKVSVWGGVNTPKFIFCEEVLPSFDGSYI